MFNLHKLKFPDIGVNITISYTDKYGKKRICEQQLDPYRIATIEAGTTDKFRFGMSIDDTGDFA